MAWFRQEILTKYDFCNRIKENYRNEVRIVNNNDSGRGLSVASLVLGICGLVIPYVGLACAIIGLILGTVGKSKAKAANAPTSMATAGIVLSIIGLAGSIIIILLCGGILATATAGL